MSDGAPAFFCCPCDAVSALFLELTRDDLPLLRPGVVGDAVQVFFAVLEESHRGKKHYHFQVRDGNAAHAVRLTIGKSEYLLRAWSLDRIDHALQPLLARGFLVSLSLAGKVTALMIAERYQHVPARKAAKAPPGAPQAPPLGWSGPPALGSPPAPEVDDPGQIGLDLGGGLALLPPPAQKPSKNENQKTNRREGASPAVNAGSEESETRDLSIGEGAEKTAGKSFARDEADSGDEVWGDLTRLLPPSEMIDNGAMWLRRLRTARRALALAVEDLKQQGGDVRSRARYLTARFEAHNQKAG